MNAVDTNVFIYAVDADEPAKQAKSVKLIERLTRMPNETVLLWQVAGEYLNQLRRWQSRNRFTATEVESAFRWLFGTFPMQLPSAKMFDISFDLRSRFSLSHWDSMLLAACKEAEVTTLYSEDMDAGTDFDGLRIVNPFV